MSSKPIIHCKGVTRDYVMGEVTVRALRGMDLDIPEGEIVTILGPSGLGKSTAFNIIGGLKALTKSLPDNHPQKKLLWILANRFDELLAGTISVRYLLLIFANPAFIEKTRDLSAENKFSMARAIELTIRRFVVTPTKERIEKLLSFLMEIGEEGLERCILDEDTSLLVVGTCGYASEVSSTVDFASISTRNFSSLCLSVSIFFEAFSNKLLSIPILFAISKA